jgi:hypothetical protein
MSMPTHPAQVWLPSPEYHFKSKSRSGSRSKLTALPSPYLSGPWLPSLNQFLSSPLSSFSTRSPTLLAESELTDKN